MPYRKDGSPTAKHTHSPGSGVRLSKSTPPNCRACAGDERDARWYRHCDVRARLEHLHRAKQRYYAFDVCPGFWQALVWQHGQGRVVSIDRVRNELTDFDDELKTWALTTMPVECFFNTDMDPVLDAYREAISWVMAEPQFTDAAKAEFADTDNADAWVIAFAKAMSATVVTHEKPNANVKRRVPIPNVCDALGVVCPPLLNRSRQYWWNGGV